MERKYKCRHIAKSVYSAIQFAGMRGCGRIFIDETFEMDDEALDICEEQEADPILGQKSLWEHININPNGSSIRIMLKNGQVFELTPKLICEVETEEEETHIMEDFLPPVNRSETP